MSDETSPQTTLSAPQNVASQTADALADLNPELDWASEWSQTAVDMLKLITGQHYRKKRATLLHLADAAMLNLPQSSVYRKRDCASKVAHYKWRHNDPAYEAAYSYLVGSFEIPGLARQHRSAELDEDEKRGVLALEEARITLRVASAEAVATLVDALEASYKTGPAWRERIQAAQAILDRADMVTAQKGSLEVTTVERAILQVYGVPSSPEGSPAGALTSGLDLANDPLILDDNVVDGVLVAATKPATTAEVAPIAKSDALSPGSQVSPADDEAQEGSTLDDDELPLTGKQLTELRHKAEALLS